MKIALIIGGVLLLALVVTYFTGPEVPTPSYDTARPQVPSELVELASSIAEREAALPVRDDNQARITFYQGKPKRTKYSVVYLHGFGGSIGDAWPLNQTFADSLQANIYHARWGDHGLKPPHSLVGFTADGAWEEAKEALAIGKRLGHKVIILSTSTGGTLALKLAATYPDDVHALVNMSPNVKDDMPGTWVLNTPWGAEIAALIGFGDGIREVSFEEPGAEQYFDTAFVSSALVSLQNLVATTMQDSVFQQITCPVLTLYYHKDWLNEDERVEVDVYDEMHAQFRTPTSANQLVPLTTPETHFLGSEIMSKDWRTPLRTALEFIHGLQ